MLVSPHKRVNPTRHPSPTAASQAPTLKKITEKKISEEKLINKNISNTIHSKVKRILNTLFFFWLKLNKILKIQKEITFNTMQRKSINQAEIKVLCHLIISEME